MPAFDFLHDLIGTRGFFERFYGVLYGVFFDLHAQMIRDSIHHARIVVFS